MYLQPLLYLLRKHKTFGLIGAPAGASGRTHARQTTRYEFMISHSLLAGQASADDCLFFFTQNRTILAQKNVCFLVLRLWSWALKKNQKPETSTIAPRCATRRQARVDLREDGAPQGMRVNEREVRRVWRTRHTVYMVYARGQMARRPRRAA